MSNVPPNRDGLASLYRDTIRRHAAAPVGYRRPIAISHRHEEYNPLCGDRIELQLQVEGALIEAAAFDGEACAICMASASMLCGLAPGRTVEALEQLAEALRLALESPRDRAEHEPDATGGGPGTAQPPPHPALPGQLHALLGVRRYPSRVRCATLPWTAARRALSGTG
jgi:nitrogen fixation NifU-like protein